MLLLSDEEIWQKCFRQLWSQFGIVCDFGFKRLAAWFAAPVMPDLSVGPIFREQWRHYQTTARGTSFSICAHGAALLLAFKFADEGESAQESHVIGGYAWAPHRN